MTPRVMLDTNTPCAQCSCPWTAPQCPTLLNPPCFSFVQWKAIYVTGPWKCRCSLPYWFFLCLSIYGVAASEDGIVTGGLLRGLPTQIILWFYKLYKVDICIWYGSNLIWAQAVWRWYRESQCLFRAQFKIRENLESQFPFVVI